MVTAADYAEWCDLAGLYLGNVSHADRYRTFQHKISPAGLSVRIVHDFLKQNDGGIDLTRWRSSDVYEIGSDAAYRVEQTAVALEAIGAPRLAARVRTVPDTSLFGQLTRAADKPGALLEQARQLDPAKMMQELRGRIARAMPDLAAEVGLPIPPKTSVPPTPDFESWEQVEYLLTRYVEAHTDDLRRDMAKYGDVRTQPGFDPEARRVELEVLRRQHADQQYQQEQVVAMTRLMDEIERLRAKSPRKGAGKLAGMRRQIVDCYRRYRHRPATELIPAMRDWLRRADAFQSRHADVFRPRPTEDPILLERLAGFGEYDVDVEQGRVVISWPAPQGLKCDWTRFSLSLGFRKQKNNALGPLLDAANRLRKRFVPHEAALRDEILRHFNHYRPQLPDWWLKDYDRDADGEPTEASILAKAGDGSIHIEDGGGCVEMRVCFRVEWDQEHGLELGLDDEPEEIEAAAAVVVFHDGGPPLHPDDLARFESEYGIALPPAYRDWLLTHNGGRPQPSHLPVRFHDSRLLMVVDRLFSLTTGSEPDTLADVLERYWAQDLPDTYLPIGRVTTVQLAADQIKGTLLLGLTGDEAGKVFVFLPHPMLVPAGSPLPPALFETLCSLAAASFPALLARLTAATAGDEEGRDLDP